MAVIPAGNSEPSTNLRPDTFCELCGCKLTQPTGAGRRRERHPECAELERALRKVEARVPIITARYGWDRWAGRDFASRLQTLRNRLPRPRFPKGHPKAGQFIKVGES